MYEVFSHTADVGLRIRAADLDTLFADAARGLFSLLVVHPEKIRPLVTRQFVIAGDEHDYLLCDWLRELLFAYDVQQLVLCQFDVHVDESGLTATCHGESLDVERHQVDCEIKAITYHDLRLERDGDQLLAEVIVDI